jgi:nudix-type nucleoside diphosphatase (YffH/AdpP family)
MAKVQIKSTQVLSDEHYTLKKLTFDIGKKDGSTETQSREVFDHGNAATALLYNREAQTIILTQQFRIATFVNGNESGMLLETPAGLLEAGENPKDSIIREIREETGYDVPDVQQVMAVYSSAGALTELIYLFVGEYLKEQKVSDGGGLEEEGEEILVREMPFAEAVAMMKQGEIRDAKTVLLLQYAQINGLLKAE